MDQHVNAAWNCFKGRVPGLLDLVYISSLWERSPGRPRDTSEPVLAAYLAPATTWRFMGSASEIYFSAITPGAELEEGVITVVEVRSLTNSNPKRLSIKRDL